MRIEQERLAFALEAADLRQWSLDRVARTAERTLRHDRIFGYETPLPEWTYEMFLRHVVPEDRVTADERFRRAVADGTEWDIECRIRRADGSYAGFVSKRGPSATMPEPSYACWVSSGTGPGRHSDSGASGSWKR